MRDTNDLVQDQTRKQKYT